MRYEGDIYRPPSEAHAFILQATIGCSWNHCTYCDMYRTKEFRVRSLDETLADIDEAAATLGSDVAKVFVADGDALTMDLPHWEAILERCTRRFDGARVSAYATARNLAEKTHEELVRLRELGLSLLYIGPESGDDVTLKKLAKGAGFREHVDAARAAREAGIELSAIFLLGAGGVQRSDEHARASASLISEMDPAFLSLLTLTVIPSTPLAKLEARGDFELPTVEGLLLEARTIIELADPTNALFRTNHVSNHLTLAGRLPVDRDRLLQLIDQGLCGALPLRPRWLRGL